MKKKRRATGTVWLLLRKNGSRGFSRIEISVRFPARVLAVSVPGPVRSQGARWSLGRATTAARRTGSSPGGPGGGHFPLPWRKPVAFHGQTRSAEARLPGRSFLLWTFAAFSASSRFPEVPRSRKEARRPARDSAAVAALWRATPRALSPTALTAPSRFRGRESRAEGWDNWSSELPGVLSRAHAPRGGRIRRSWPTFDYSLLECQILFAEGCLSGVGV